MEPVPDLARISLYLVVLLLLSLALAATLALGAPGAIPAPPPHSVLPATVPGLTREEGVFLVTAADDGSRAIYFIAQNTRHSIAESDLQLEQQLNPLWPVRFAAREDVLAFAEAAPIGSARSGLIGALAATPVDEAPAEKPVAETPAPSADPPVLSEPAMSEPAIPAPRPAAPSAPSAPTAITIPPRSMPAPAIRAPQTPAAALPAPSTMPHAPLSEPGRPARSPGLQPAPAEPILYVLQPGDNLIRIAARYGTSVEAILASNGIADPNRIYFGQPLLIPSAAPDVVEPSTSPAALEADPQSPVAEAPATEPVTLARPESTTYTVKRGDSAITIAREFGVGLDDLLATNGVVNRNRVYIGQVLDIPGA